LTIFVVAALLIKPKQHGKNQNKNTQNKQKIIVFFRVLGTWLKIIQRKAISNRNYEFFRFEY
jgi:hypothetical protein